MAYTLKLPRQGGSLYPYRLKGDTPVTLPQKKSFHKRTAFAAAHVVCDPFTDADPVTNPHIDWEATLQYRHYLWSLGLAVAEAMDTAQRGMGLHWEQARELIRRSVKEAHAVGGRIACGVGTDQLEPSAAVTLADVERAYEEQCEWVEAAGGQIILMASRALAACAKGPEDYEQVYGNLLRRVSRPVILHWLGEMFDPKLKGYWGHENPDEAMKVCLRVIHENPQKVDGIKISLLDADAEIRMRRLLPEHVRMYTGDDFHYPSLIRGDEHGYSHALLGIFDGIAPAAATALEALDEGNLNRYDAVMEKTVPLSRHIFQQPTYAYKTGIVFLAYLNGHQSHFRMIGGAEGHRSVIHLAKMFELADQAGVLLQPELAVERMRLVLAQVGIR
ncbi:dihydrodipicolinate synthase family protein [Desmospora activa]|uniref:Uncharacterized protein DUF993 n=1 Tax=Desmospora activa DSM 45169 TaxID=1121389 RepID=A0A2T4Z7S9_9BACL|nr:dihydrodipicolinate synthase family protein [Desmospora activa]PTM57958.1 uncharacterized protein DUF993 [Desmospora activa DSM 45169]